MGFQRKSGDNLAIEGHAALEPWNGREEPVEVTSTAPETATVKGEAYAGNEDKVQFVQREDGALGTRLGDAKAAGGKIDAEIRDPARGIVVAAGDVAGQGDDFAGRERVGNEWRYFRFVASGDE